MFEKILRKTKDLGKLKPRINIPPTDAPIPELKLSDLDKDLRDRISVIKKEFINGFAFIRNHKQSVTFFGSARFEEDHPYYKKALSLGKRFAEVGFDVITGGGPGIMEAGNRGAYESHGPGKSLGFNIELPQEQILNPYVHDHVTFYYFFTRKVALTFSAEAYVFFPGGLGTLDEFFEIVTLIQTEKIPRVPVICVGNDFWGAVDTLIQEKLLHDYKTVSPEDLMLYTVTEDEDTIVDIVKSAPLRDE